jgi:fatty acid desaturase
MACGVPALRGVFSARRPHAIAVSDEQNGSDAAAAGPMPIAYESVCLLYVAGLSPPGAVTNRLHSRNANWKCEFAIRPAGGLKVACVRHTAEAPDSLSSKPKRAVRVDVITSTVAAIILAGFIALTLSFASLPRWLVATLGSLLLTWYGSLQHETIHGHPTRSRRFNRLLGSLPLTLWIPYALYRESHLRHHRHEGRYLTHADRDPESFYWHAPAGRRGRLLQTIHHLNGTLTGRLLIGPVLCVSRFWAAEMTKIRRGVGRRRLLWLRHACGLMLLAAWLVLVCHLPLWFYAACMVYPSIALGLLRSFAEHRADIDVRRRTRVIEAGPLWRLVFLNNNLHIAHHAYPHVPWHRLPLIWAVMRDRVTSQDLVIAGGYLELAKRFMIRSVLIAERAPETPT